jgi:hypothetical protein
MGEPLDTRAQAADGAHVETGDPADERAPGVQARALRTAARMLWTTSVFLAGSVA